MRRTAVWLFGMGLLLAAFGLPASGQEPAAEPAAEEAAPAEGEPSPVFKRPGFDRPGGGSEGEGTDAQMRPRTRKDPGPPLAMPDYEYVTVPDRWRIVESIGVNERWYDPYNQSTWKGDRPIFGTQDWFLNVNAVWDTTVEPRRVPVPAGIANPQGQPLDIFGSGDQLIVNQNWIGSFSFINGNQTFRPPDWEFRVTGIANINYVKTDEIGLVYAKPSKGDDRFDYWFSLTDLWVEKHLWNKSDRYDFDAIRVGIQPFTSDFRGFLFQDAALGARLFGTFRNNRIQYNVGWFRQIEKEINSGLPQVLDLREDDIFVGNVYYQDFPTLGFTTQLIAAYNRNREGNESIQRDDNGFQQRPAPFGQDRKKNYDIVYLGLNGDGHIDRVNLSYSFYWAGGEERPNLVRPTGKSSKVSAFFAALEASMDFDWYRLKAFGLFGSGDDDVADDHSAGFDAIFENPNFAGADTSYWVRQNVPFIFGGGVALSQRNAILNNLRTSKEQGQSNFVNPGIGLVGVGADFDVLPQLRVIGNFSWLNFIHTESLEVLRQQAGIDNEIGWDLSVSLLYRPMFIENVVLRGSAAFLIPGKGFKDLYPNDQPYYSALFNVVLSY